MTETTTQLPTLAVASPLPASHRAVAPRSPWRSAWRRLRSNPMGITGAVIVLGFTLLAVLGPILSPRDPYYQDLLRISEPPSSDYWLGTDEIGRDFLSRIMVGARTALIIATLVTFIAATIGALFGLISAYVGGWVDSAIMRFADMVLALPTFLLAAFVSATLRAPVENRLSDLGSMTGIEALKDRATVDFLAVFGALTVVTWPGYARLIRSQVLSIREREFIEAARGLGASTPRILMRHILPNSIAPIIVAVSVNFGNAILSESALSYLGIGIQPPTPSWGQMINANLDQWRYYPHLIIVPSSVLALLILGFNFFGDAVADALDPRQSRR